MHHTRTASALTGLRGCFVTNATLELLPHDKELTLKIESIMRRTSTLLTAAVIRGQAEGVFNTELDEKAVGDFLLCVTQGLRVIGKFVHDEERLAGVVDMAMRALMS
jgi:TetR/AcrR family transcriptional repressor of nem operon